MSLLEELVYRGLEGYPAKALLPMLRDRSQIVRYAAARKLQLLGDEQVHEDILALAICTQPRQREIAAFTLGQYGAPRRLLVEKSAPVLLTLLGDSDAGVRSAAASSLGWLFDCAPMPDHVEVALRSGATDPAAEVRASVAFSLAYSSGSADTRCVLSELTHDESGDVRGWADFAIDVLG